MALKFLCDRCGDEIADKDVSTINVRVLRLGTPEDNSWSHHTCPVCVAEVMGGIKKVLVK